MTILRGDQLLLTTNIWGLAIGPVFKVNSYDEQLFAVPVDIGICQLPVDLRSVVEVWRNGQPVAQQLDLFEGG